MDRKLILAGMTMLGFFLRASAEPERISVKHGNHAYIKGDSAKPRFTSDQRYVIFESLARLTPEDRNRKKDFYRYDRETKELRRTWITEPFPPRGNYVLYTSTYDGTSDVQILLYNQVDKTTELISRTADGAPFNRLCAFPRISTDAAVVAFLSAATNAEPPLPPDSLAFHLYRRDRRTGVTERIDVFEKGFSAEQWAVGAFDMDASGNFIVFQARRRSMDSVEGSREVYDLFGYDANTGQVKLMTTGLFSNKARHPVLSRDGQHLVFVYMGGKMRGTAGELVVWSRVDDKWSKILDGACDNPSLSADDSTLVFDQEDKQGRNIYILENPFGGPEP